MDREVALKILAEKPYNSEIIEQEKKYIAKKLTISLDDFEAILKYPPKFYWNYPNDEQRLNFIYNTYRKLFKKEKLGSF
jgi:hypothetical protein